MATPQLDKSLSSALAEGYGTITIRVVVVEKGMASSPAPRDDDTPADTEPDEVMPERDKRPISTFLEEPKRGKQCGVFLINGQRQHAWDNQFIVRDLDMKYLRNRMIVIVNCDGLKPEATSQLMQGSRFQFYEGTVYWALESRVIATLKGDPDLRQLEEQAEDEISSLQAGDEAVKAALDQLIDAHHDAAEHVHRGEGQPGEANHMDGVAGPLIQSQPVVVDGEASVGVPASDPVLMLRPDIATIRLKPNETRKYLIHPRPDTAWQLLETMALTFDPPVKEMIVTRIGQAAGDEIALKFVETDDFDEEEYPIESMMRATAVFRGHPEVRILERRVVITRSKKTPPKPRTLLKDDPTYIKVTSRQPIKLLIDGPDVHVKLKWDGNDELVNGNPPPWSFRFTCDSPSIEPPAFLTRPTNGRFELLVQAAPGLTAGEQLKFDIEAVGPIKTLATAFLVDVVEPSSARKISAKLLGGGQRRPPYELRYVTRDNWDGETCWGQAWNGGEPGAFEEPSTKSPLVIFINQDADLLAAYRETLISKKRAESTIQQNINKYTTHVAFHLYQIYEKRKQVTSQPSGPGDVQTEDQMREEIQRVARTLLKLMDMT
jgi:hypothetical protein